MSAFVSTKAAQKAAKIRQELDQRLNLALEWYHDCYICEETLQNARRDVLSIYHEVLKKHGITDFPLTLKVFFDSNGFIVVEALDRKLN